MLKSAQSDFNSRQNVESGTNNSVASFFTQASIVNATAASKEQPKSMPIPIQSMTLESIEKNLSSNRKFSFSEF